MAMWRLGSEVQTAQEGDGTILLNLQDGTFYSVTPIGRLIIDRLRDGKDVSGVVDELERLYGEPRARLEADVTSFIQDLVQRGLCHADDE
jgi:hypothetical protein